ncbi:MAG: dihydrolipoamide acetyltransferase family protein [Planctomycetota bacterium]
MPIPVTMPRLSDTMEEGTLLKWNVAVGDKVSAQDVLADVETDKATMELQTFDEGALAKIVIDEGQTVAVGQVIAVLAEPGESVEDAANADLAPGNASDSAPASDAPADTSTPEPADPGAATNSGGGATSGGGGGKIKASPLARKLAEEHGVDLAAITGTGPDGRIIKRDVLNAAKGGPATPSTPATSGGGSGVASGGAPAQPIAAMGPSTLEAKTVPVPGMRKTIAKRLVESKTTVPHFQVSVAVAMDPLMELRGTINKQLESQGVKLSVNDFVTRAVALAALQHPEINSSWTGDAIQYHAAVNVGAAIALPAERGGGLVVAVIKNVESKGLRIISQEMKELADKARGRGLPPEDMADSTITVSNLGMPKYGVTQFTAIVNPPNAAIVAIGGALQKPVVRNGEITIGLEMNVTLSGDHRVIDGAMAAEYLTTLRGLLENPASLLV